MAVFIVCAGPPPAKVCELHRQGPFPAFPASPARPSRPSLADTHLPPSLSQNQKPEEDGGGPGTEEDVKNATEKEVEIEKELKAKLDKMGVEIVKKASEPFSARPVPPPPFLTAAN